VSGERDAKGEMSQDIYQGISWADRARFGILAAVLDPADTSGKKNRFLDAVHRRALRAAVGGRHFKRALDFGCGTGRFLSFLAERADEVYALDRTPEMLDVARTVWQMPQDRFVCWRELALPFSDGNFDLILCIGVLCTMRRPDFERAIRELQRVCADNGSAVFIEQVDHSRDLGPSTYMTSFDRAGFELVSAFPIRTSSSLIMRIASRQSFPQLIPALAAAEMLRINKAKYLLTTKGYWDYCFVLRKKSGA